MSKEYWRKRAEDQMIKNHLEADKVIKRAERFITDATVEIEADIFKWYVRIADNNEIGFEDAKKLLKADELEEFHWTVDEYIKYGKENAMNGAWMKELENASAKVHINRLEQAKLEMRQAVEKAYNRIDKSIGDHAKGIVKDTYMRTAFDFQKGIGLGWSFSQIDDKKLAQLISKPWASDGKCFSDRLWTNKTALVENLNKELSMWVLRGDSIQNMTKRLSAKMNVDKKKCARLIRTETTFIAERASLESYKELGVEQVEIIGTLDSTTCELCGDLDGAIVRLTDMEAGITTPPFHPSCRCTTAPYDEEDFIEVRTARNEDGEVYEVPGDMTYKEWKKGNIDTNGENDIINTAEIEKLFVISTSKFVDYALNPEKAPDKARAFKVALGYDLNNYELLKANILEHIDESKFTEKGNKGYGMTYEYIVMIEGQNGKKAKVLTAWIQDGNKKRLTSIYVTNKKVSMRDGD